MVNVYLEILNILLWITSSCKIYSHSFARCRMVFHIRHIFLIINIMTGATYRILSTKLFDQHLRVISRSLVQKYLQLLFPSCHNRFAAVDKVYWMMLIFHQFICIAHSAEGIKDIMLTLLTNQTFQGYL